MVTPTTQSVQYSAQGKLLDLAYEISQARSLAKPEIKKKIAQASTIFLWLQSLSYTVLTKAQRDKIVLCLISVAKINEFPVAPVLGQIDPPNIGSGGGGNTVINNNYYISSSPFQNADVDGIEAVDLFPITSARGCVWQYTVTDGTNQRSGILQATWLSDGSVIKTSHTSTDDIGNTSGVTLNIDFNAGNIRLIATALTPNWIVEGNRFLIYTSVGTPSGGGGSGGASNFVDLGDVPASYLGHGGEVITVKVAEDGLEFSASGGVGGGTWGTITGTITDQTDLVTYIGDAITSAITTYLVNADETTRGFVEEGTQAEVNAGTAVGGTGAKLFITPAKLLAITGTFANKLTLTAAPRFSSTTASQFLKVDSNKDLVSVAPATSSDLVTGTDNALPITSSGFTGFRDLIRRSASIGGGIMTLDWLSKAEAIFENTTAQSTGFLVAFSNWTNLEEAKVILYLTGSVAITMPNGTSGQPNVVMEEIEEGIRWSNSTKILTLTGATASPFILYFERLTSDRFKLTVGTRSYAS